MKNKKRMSINESRRRFMAYFSSVGLGSTLVPGILWGKMQETGSQQVTLDMLTTALKLGGVEFNADERQAMVNTANQNLTRSVAMRSFHIPNDVSPPFHINAIVPGVIVNKTPQPFALSKVPALKVPGNLEDVAFWPVRHLAELLRTKQVSSVELTKMYLERLHRYNGQLLNTVTFLDELAMTQAKAADAEIAQGKYRSPLHGIPWGCKDIISRQGLQDDVGLRRVQRSGFRLRRQRCRDAARCRRRADREADDRRTRTGRQLVRRTDEESMERRKLERIVGRTGFGDGGRLRGFAIGTET